MKMNGKRSLLLLMIIPVLLLVQLGIGMGIYAKIKRTAVIEANNNKLDLYLRTNTKYISYSESALRGYLITDDQKYYENYKSYLDEWKKNESYYDSLPPEVKRKEVIEIKAVSLKKLDVMALTFQLFNAHDKDSALILVKSGLGQILMDSLRSKSTFLRTEIGGEITTERNGEYQLLYIFFAVVAGLITFSLILAWLTYKAFNQYTASLEGMVTSLEAANEKMLQYNYNSYHSLKTPLRNITGFLQLLEKKYTGQLDAEAKEYIHYIIDGVTQLGAIIVDMRRNYLESEKPERQKRD